jgi:hypothetical protein
MMKHKIRITFGLLLIAGLCFQSQGFTADADIEILKRIVDRLKENDEVAGNYGFWQDSNYREFNSEGEVTEEETRTYRTIWVNDSRYMELIKVNGKELDKDHRAKEEKRKKKFLKETEEKPDVTLENKMEVTWDDLVEKYDLVSDQPEGDAVHVISFKPKVGKKKERNRIEKILNHISGKIWVDSQYNILRAHLRLTENVKYGLGILANVENVELHYRQKKVADVWFPEGFQLNYKARVLVKKRIRAIDSRFYDFVPRESASVATSQ